jgi:hypothetical protein
MREYAEGGEFDGLFIRFSRHGWYGTVRRIFWIWMCRMHLGWGDDGTMNLLTVGKSGLDGGLRGWADGG